MQKKAPKINSGLFEKAKGISLDVGCGQIKQKGFIGMDIEDGPNVDIVHDIQEFPWPVPDDVCKHVLMSHVFEHIEPKYRFRVMDEIWRICRWDGQLWLSCPYAGSFLESAHPAHYPCPNEAAFEFFDPAYQLWHASGHKKPLPWKIIKRSFAMNGCIEVVMEPRKDKKGKALSLEQDMPAVQDSVKLFRRKETD